MADPDPDPDADASASASASATLCLDGPPLVRSDYVPADESGDPVDARGKTIALHMNQGVPWHSTVRSTSRGHRVTAG